MIPDLRICMATDENIREVAMFSRITFFDTYNVYNTKKNMYLFLHTNLSDKSIAEEIAAPQNTFMLIKQHHRLLGYVKLIEEDNNTISNSIEIARIYVDTGTKGKGLGKLLLNACLDLAKEKKKKTLWLGVWEKNLPAIRFYLQNDFTKFGEHPFLLGEDIQNDWLMQRFI